MNMAESKAMRRALVRAYGGPEQLQVEAMAEAPRPGPGELLVDVEAAGVNFIDTYQRKGIGIHGTSLPLVLGLEGVGRVREAGEGAGQAVGSRVAWIDVPGSYASQVVVPAARVVQVPGDLVPPQALLFQALTAQYLAAEYRDVRPGDRVLVHAAAGGVGQLLVQWLKHLGAWVVGTTSSEAKAAAVRAAGADAVIVYGRDYAFVDELRSLTEGRGVDLAFDGVGAATLLATLEGLARGGTAVLIGQASGPAPAIQPTLLTARAIRLAGGSVFTFTQDAPELQRRAAMVIDAVRAGWLRMSEGTAYALDRAADAHRAIERRGTRGKLYLTP
jgi:NADPH2:quinone reductase